MKFVCHADASGNWSNQVKAVTVSKLAITYLSESGLVDSDFGELRAYFDTKTWDVGTDGLIYTDKLWLKEFRAALMTAGFSEAAVNDVEYSEQGMQGVHYVSLDIGRAFIAEVEPFLRFAAGKAPLDIKIELNTN